mgnify:CR=1 FL=1
MRLTRSQHTWVADRGLAAPTDTNSIGAPWKGPRGDREGGVRARGAAPGGPSAFPGGLVQYYEEIWDTAEMVAEGIHSAEVGE